ncbi:MAG: radical SAM protein [Candidatus Micrarchaeia archaeon]
MNSLIEENKKLNDLEYQNKEIYLKSYPLTLFVQLDAPCTQNCIFCSREKYYRYFDFDEFREKFEPKLYEALIRAERINLTGSGELLLLPRIKEILGYFNQFEAEKMFATNGSTLSAWIFDFLIESNNKYIIHISLHSCDRKTHTLVAGIDNFDVILHNLDYIRNVKEFAKNITINFIFVLTNKNIVYLPDFIKFAKEYKADAVIAYYNYIYTLSQKEISCFFCKELTNEKFEEASRIAKEVGIKLFLPPKFNQVRQENYNDRICREAWSNLMINFKGDIICCDAARDSYENILEKNFMDVWNGKYFIELRKSLINKTNSCFELCFRANPSSVDKFLSHLITRGKSKQDIEKFLEGVI